MTATLEAHQGILIAKLRRMARAIFPPAAPVNLAVSVAAGLQHGNVHEVSADTISLGSAEDCDVVLFDDGIEPKHATLITERSVFGELVAVKTDMEHVRFAGQDVITGAQTPFESLPVTLHLGDTELLLSKGSAPSEQPRRASGIALSYLMRGSLVAALCAVFLFYPWKLPDFLAESRYQLSMPETSAPVAVNVAGRDSVHAALRQKVLEGELSNYLKISLQPGDSVTVEGILPPEKVGTWRRIHEWYDGQGAGELLIAKVAVAPRLSDFPPISTVKLSDPPHIVFADGQQVRVGEQVADGWHVTAITADGFVLERRGEILSISF